MSYTLKVKVALPDEDIAIMIKDIVGVDKEFKKHEITRNLSVENNYLIIEYISNDMKLIRNGFNTLCEHIDLALKTIKEFS